MESSSIRVAILDDHPATLAGYRSYLGQSPKLTVVTTALFGEEIEEGLATHSVDLLLCDIEVRQSQRSNEYYPILHAIATWQKQYPEMIILANSMHTHKNLVLAVLDAGASGYIYKDDLDAYKNLPQIIVDLVEEQIHIYLSQSAENLITNSPLHDIELTPRQIEALSICATHPEFTSKKVGQLMGISGTGARNLLSQAYIRLGVSNLPSAIEKSRQLGFIPVSTSARLFFPK